MGGETAPGVVGRPRRAIEKERCSMASDAQSSDQRDFTVRNDLSELDWLPGAVREFLAQRGASEKTLFTVDLVLEEVVTNIIKYAYLDARSHQIAVHVELTPEQALLVVEDDGQPFNPAEATEPGVERRLEDRPIGGLGIHLVRRMVQFFEYERRGGRNHLEIRVDRESE
jgi:anti-sigma regulatory factor (Ser/Thr protein kinase)